MRRTVPQVVAEVLPPTVSQYSPTDTCQLPENAPSKPSEKTSTTFPGTLISTARVAASRLSREAAVQFWFFAACRSAAYRSK